MRSITCSRCGAVAPRGESLEYRGSDYCGRCGDDLRGEADEGPEAFHPLVDPTVCAFCGADGGDSEHAAAAGLPACPACAERLYRAPLPRWVRGFLAAVAAVLVVCTALNLPYYRAWLSIRRAGPALAAGEHERAAAFMGAASAALPDNRELEGVAALYAGLSLAAKGEEREALARFRTYLSLNPADQAARFQALSLESAVAFEDGDYRTFYRLQTEILAGDPADPMRRLAKASAAACLWAAYGEAERRAEAEATVAAVLAGLPAGDREAAAAAGEYARRIRFRIDTREIIDRDEYYRRHPEEASK
ncbi:MAG: hypothetical protein JNG85_04270 [Spirochaetaceae bacterium]|nr:hypothetical protein [Spirochaetaceae bacterium]